MTNNKEIINEMLKNGAKQIANITVKNVTVKQMDAYTRLGLSLDTEIDGYQTDENGEYQEAKTNIIFVSTFAIASTLKNDDNAAFAANHLVSHPDALGIILSRAKITVVQQTVGADEEYVNPFASSGEATVFGHPVIINHVVDIKLSDFGLKKLDRLADLMLGFE